MTAGSSPVITGNNISGNTATNYSGSGGISVHYESSPIIGGANDSDTDNFNTICGNIPNQIVPEPDDYPNNYISIICD